MTKILLFGNSVIVLGVSLNTIGLGITIGPKCFSLTLLFLSIIIEDVNDTTIAKFRKAKEKNSARRWDIRNTKKEWQKPFLFHLIVIV